MRITKMAQEPIEQFPYLTAGAGDKGVIQSWLPIYLGEMAEMPDWCDAVIVTSDLQGVTESDEHEQVLLGEVLPAFVSLLLQVEKPSVRPERTLVLLCGDLYADPLKRGSSGDPLSVWTAFRQEFGHVVGVAGNHDLFEADSIGKLRNMERVTLISEPEIVLANQLRIAGLGGIIGLSDKANRRDLPSFLQSLAALLRKEPDVLLLHQGPDEPALGLPGVAEIRTKLQQHAPTLVCCGHVHWAEHLVEWTQGTQVLNADGKLFVFTRANEKSD